ncbi:MAG: divalent-cation tolerance protein CutA [Gemmatimonadota bacterium]
MDELRTVLITAPDIETGQGIARRLVEERLAACANIVSDVTSIFRWEGEVQEVREVLLIIKTTAARTSALIRRAAELHPYDVPEVLALPVLAGYEPYLDWVRDGCAGEPL